MRKTILNKQYEGGPKVISVLVSRSRVQEFYTRQTGVSGTAIFKNWNLVCDYALKLGPILLKFLIVDYKFSI